MGINSIISSISVVNVLIICILLLAIILPFAIISTKKSNKKKAEFLLELKNIGFVESQNLGEILKSLNKMPNFENTIESNISQIFKKVKNNFIIYYFLHHEWNTEGYSRDLRCILVESRKNNLIPKMTIQPLAFKNRITLNLDKWKAPEIHLDIKSNKSFRIRTDNEEWFKNIFDNLLLARIEDIGVRISIAYEGNDNAILGYLIGNESNLSSTNHLVEACLEVIKEIDKNTKIKYSNK